MADQTNKIVTKAELDATQARAELDKLNKEAAAGQETLTKKVGETKKETFNLSSATGNLGKSFSGLLTGMKNVAAGFRGIGTAIALTGIGLLVITVAALKAAFSSSEEGQNKFAKIMGVIGAITGNLLDLLADLGEKIIWVFENPRQAMESFAKSIKDNIQTRFEGLITLIPSLGKAITLLFQGKFGEAGKVAADAVGKVALGMDSVTDSINNAGKALGNFIDEQKKEGAAAAKVADMRARAAKLDRALLVERAKIEAKVAELKLKAREEDSYSAAERKKFLLEAQSIEDSLLTKEKESLQLKYNAQKLENTFSRTNIENLDKEAQAQADLYNIETKRFTEQKATQRELLRVDGQLKKQQDTATKEAEAKAKEIKDKADAEAKEKADKEASDREANTEAQNELDQLEIDRKRANGERTLELELELLERKRLQDIAAADLTAKEIEVINKKSQLAKDAVGKAEEKALLAKNKAEYDSNVATAAESFGIAQEVAIAKMVMNAPEAIGNSFTQAAKSYAPPLSLAMGALGAAGVIVPIIKGLSDIKKARFSKSKGGGSPSGSISTATGAGASAITPELIDSAAANNSARLGLDSSIGGRAGASAANNVLGGSSPQVTFSEAKYREFQNQVAFKEEKTTI